MALPYSYYDYGIEICLIITHLSSYTYDNIIAQNRWISDHVSINININVVKSGVYRLQEARHTYHQLPAHQNNTNIKHKL